MLALNLVAHDCRSVTIQKIRIRYVFLWLTEISAVWAILDDFRTIFDEFRTKQIASENWWKQ